MAQWGHTCGRDVGVCASLATNQHLHQHFAAAIFFAECLHRVELVRVVPGGRQTYGVYELVEVSTQAFASLVLMTHIEVLKPGDGDATHRQK